MMDAARVLDALPYPVTTVDLDGRVLFMNRTALGNMRAVGLDALLGSSVYDWFPERAQATRQRLKQTVAARTTQAFESLVELPSGSTRLFSAHYHPLFDDAGQVVAVTIENRDITDKRLDSLDDEALWGLVTDDLSMTIERVRALLDNAPVMIGVFSTDMTVRYLNRVIPGVDIDDLIGSDPRPWIAPASRPVFEAAFARVVRDGRPTDCEAVGASGRNWLVRLAPLVHEGDVKQVLACILDITDLARLQGMLAQRKKVESLGTMARGIAHDFNNVLTVIVGRASLARIRLDGRPDAVAMLDEIEAAALRAAALCEQMLVFAGRDLPSVDAIDVDAVIEEMTPLTRAALNARIELTYALGDPPPARCNRGHLGQIVLNLVNNAADAIGDGYGTIRVTTAEVVPDPTGDHLPGPPPPGHYVQLTVEDDGPGIAADARSMVFDPFFSTKSQGHGLGLSVVLGIVSSHGGAIRVVSQPGEGTAMHVILPVHDGGVAELSDAGGDGLPIGTGTVLVVDDEQTVRDAAADLLRTVGYQVLAAADGDEALGVLAERGEAVRAVLLDVNMPNRDGWSTLAAIRATRPELPVVLCSGQPAEHRPDDPQLWHLRKPYSHRKLIRLLADAVRPPR